MRTHVRNLVLRNETSYPVVIGEKVRDSKINTIVEILKNEGEHNEIIEE